MNRPSVGPLVWIASLICFAPICFAQETPAQRHEMATNHLKRLAAEMSARCLTDIRTMEDWSRQRPKLRQQLLEMLSLDPLPQRTPLRPRITGVLDRPNYRIEKVVFQSMPGLYVTGNFYVPKSGQAGRKLPVVLYLCGHAPHPLGAKFHYQDRAAALASLGFACLILDTLEFAEVAGIHHGTHDLNLWHWRSLGYTPAGVEVWNAIRAMDYLETRSEVDARRIGLTGISGGGAITWYTAAVDERVAAAAPVCSTFTFGSQAKDWLAAGQCDCIYYHNSYAWDFPIVAALIAPRPLLILSGQKDGTFPPEGYHEVFQRAKWVYDLYAGGASERIREVDADVGHSDPPLFLHEARQWMRRWIQNDPTPLAPLTNVPPAERAEDLACLTKLPEDAINYKIHNEFVKPATLKLPGSVAAWEARRNELLTQLWGKVFRWFPQGPIAFETKVLRNTGGWVARYARYKDVSFQSESGARIRAQYLAVTNGAATAPLLVYVKRPGDSIYFMDFDELLPVLGRWNVLVLQPRFAERPLTAVEYADIENTAAWTGRTVAGLQVWDVLRAIQWAFDEEQLRPASLALYGKGEMGIVALYAGLLDERVTQVVLNDPPGSHWQKPALPNVLRVTDIPEAAAASAPRRLVSLTKLPEPFRFTERVYGMKRASKSLTQADSLPEALEVWKR